MKLFQNNPEMFQQFIISLEKPLPHDSHQSMKTGMSEEKTHFLWIHTLRNSYSKCPYHRTLRENESARKKNWLHSGSYYLKLLYTGTSCCNISTYTIKWRNRYRKISYPRYGIKSVRKNNTTR